MTDAAARNLERLAHVRMFVMTAAKAELYKLDASIRCNGADLWHDAGYAKIKSELIADLRDNLLPTRSPRLTVESPV